MSMQFRKPRRVSITVSDVVYQLLVEMSDHQGRSLSNFASFLLESSLVEHKSPASEQGIPSLAGGVHLQRSLQPAAMLRH